MSTPDQAPAQPVTNSKGAESEFRAPVWVGVGVRRELMGRAFHALCLFATLAGIAGLAVLLIAVSVQAWGWLDWQFLTSYDDLSKPAKAGILAGFWGSSWLIVLTALFSIPMGVGAAVYLEEYAKGTWLTRLIQLNIANLAGVPSIVYGILGLTVFVRNLGLFGTARQGMEVRLLGIEVLIPLPLGPVVLSGALTLSLLVLPTVIIATQEALRSIPASLRHASLALGATKWQTIRFQVLPAAIPGILTGVILALSRAMGEAAPLLMLGVPTYLSSTPGGIDSVSAIVEDPSGLIKAPFTVGTAMPLLVFNWVSLPKRDFRHVAAAGILVLMGLLLAMNAAAIVIRQRFTRRIRW
jgi:phosphate transport system permease protein